MSLIVISVSCSTTPHLTPHDTDARLAPVEARAVRSSCELAERRCSRCHTLDRVVLHEPASPRGWQDQVMRMRRIAGSTISRAEGDAIARCLVFRSFGPAGLSAL